MSSLDNLIRKLRKKLRQIENLERLNRPLTEEEAVKLCSKDEVREKLQTALEKYNEGGENADRQTGPSAATKTDSVFSETRGDGDSSDSFSHGHLEESPEQSKQKVPTIDTDKSTQIKERIQHQDQGDTKKQKPSVKKVKSRLSEHICQVSYLEGHSDLITSLVVFGNEAVTASRDTTIKYWDLTQGTEIHHFGSHLGAVTSLIVLDRPEEFAVAEDKLIISGSSDCKFRLWNLSEEFAVAEKDKLIISGSLDCTFRLWNLSQAQMLKTVYTYNPVVQIAYCSPAKVLVTGSDGGKLMLWNMISFENSFSACVHNASVTGLKVSGDLVYSSASDGVIKVHQVTESGQLTCLFVSEDVKTTSGNSFTARHVRCLAAASPDVLYFGDDARNIKVLNWKKGVVSKLSNHTSSYTSADALCCHDDYLISSSYDLDEGLGYINIRSSNTLEYLATVDDQNTERIVCLDFGHSSSSSLFVVTGGMDLKLWEILPAESVDKGDELEDIFSLEFRPVLAKSAVDSEIESSSADDSDTDGDVDNEGRARKSQTGRSDTSASGWLSWCSVL